MFLMLHKTNKAVVLCRGTPGRSETSAMKFAELLGAEAMAVSVVQVQSANGLKDAVPPCPALIAHCDTLLAMVDATETREQVLLSLTELSANVFVYGFGSNERHAPILRVLSSGALAGSKSPARGDLLFTLSKDYRGLCGAFSGLTISAADPA